MEALLVSSGVVAVAEMGDKTQLLALILATRFKRPWLICLGILIATLANHAAAAAAGKWVTLMLGPDALRWILGVFFIAMAVWALIPDKADDVDASARRGLGVLGTTVFVFFLAEMGDKTQLATVALSASYTAFTAVVIGTSLGMMIANVPAVFAGEALTRRIPLRAMRVTAAVLFAVLGVLSIALPQTLG